MPAHLAVEREEGERRDEDAEEDREPAEPRDRTLVEAARVGLVDDAEQARHAADGRGQQDDDAEGDQRAPDDLGVVAQVLNIGAYFVPYSRSPASPRPGTM